MLFANQQDTLQVCCEDLSTSCYLEGTSNLQLLGSAFYIPQPQAEWSPGQSTKWLFATKHLEMPEGSHGLSASPGSQSHSHTHSVKASVPAGMAKLGPASLSPPAVGTGVEPRVLWEQAEVGEAGNGRLTRPGGGKGREGKGFQDLCPGLRLPLGITQLRLGSPDHKPPGKWGTEKGEEGGLEHWDFGGSQCY